MTPLFVHGASPNIRVVVCVCLSLMLMTLDHRTPHLDVVRKQLAVLVSPLYYLINFPIAASRWLSSGVSSRFELISENQRLDQENLVLKARLQRFEDLQSENNRLRQLLGASPKTAGRLLVAQVLSVDLGPETRKLVINKGSWHGVDEDLPVLDAHGVVGQVARVNPFTSVIMLITDANHSLPVQVVRTGFRTLAEGTGSEELLSLLYLPKTAEISVGDLIATSGLGDRFPPGYPVGEVIEVEPEADQSYTHAEMRPSARLDRNREVLLLWPEKAREAQEEKPQVIPQ